MIRIAGSMAFASTREASRKLSPTPTCLVADKCAGYGVRAWMGLGAGVWRESVRRVAYSTTVVSKTPICLYDGCSTQASFGIVERKPLYCKSHKEENMDDVKNKRCAYEGGCRSLNPVFNHPNSSKGVYCVKHKADGMEDVMNRRCIYEGCKTRPYYNDPGEKKGVFCVKHKLDGMEDITNNRCAYDGCRILNPVFNYTCEKKGLYCGTHKLEHMENIISNRCKHEGCRIFIRGKGIHFCSKHRASAAANT